MIHIVLIDPKYPHNIGAAIRAASCFGIESVTWSGDRAKREIDAAARIPREERMRGYKEVELYWHPKPLAKFTKTGAVPVCVELLHGATMLPDFQHPQSAVYVFGPEDGSVPKAIRSLCHHFVFIPSYHCLNLAASVYVTLYDRMVKEYQRGEGFPMLIETRGDMQFLLES